MVNNGPRQSLRLCPIWYDSNETSTDDLLTRAIERCRPGSNPACVRFGRADPENLSARSSTVQRFRDSTRSKPAISHSTRHLFIDTQVDTSQPVNLPGQQ